MSPYKQRNNQKWKKKTTKTSSLLLSCIKQIILYIILHCMCDKGLRPLLYHIWYLYNPSPPTVHLILWNIILSSLPPPYTNFIPDSPKVCANYYANLWKRASYFSLKQQLDKFVYYSISSELSFSIFYNKSVDFTPLYKVAVAFCGGMLQAQVHGKFRGKECSKKTEPKALWVVIWKVDKTMINNGGKKK